jgi:hypothetical protein
LSQPWSLDSPTITGRRLGPGSPITRGIMEPKTKGTRNAPADGPAAQRPQRPPLASAAGHHRRTPLGATQPQGSDAQAASCRLRTDFQNQQAAGTVATTITWMPVTPEFYRSRPRAGPTRATVPSWLRGRCTVQIPVPPQKGNRKVNNA